jgi:hypothetical protein
MLDGRWQFLKMSLGQLLGPSDSGGNNNINNGFSIGERDLYKYLWRKQRFIKINHLSPLIK